MNRFSFVCVVVAIGFASSAKGQDRPTKVRNDKERVEAQGFWIYNDLPRGVAEAKKSGKPLLVVFRCIPCEACAQLDERVVERDPAVQELLSQFVCVRIVHANGMDLSLFRFDYDQSWTAFLLNADMTIYGRYGTRSHQTESEQDVSLEGFAKALGGALELHREYPKNKEVLTAKRGPASDVKVPEEFPNLAGKYKSKIDYEGQVVQSCIHCHQVGESLRLLHRTAGRSIPETTLYPYPNPRVLGLEMNPKEKATIARVAAGSTAERDGVRAGDEILTLNRQPILSTADIQWVLHNSGDTGSVAAEVARGGKTIPIQLTLEKGWRRRDNISWRATSWDLRRMVTGGLLLEELPEADRRTAGLADSSLALRVKHVGEYGEHAVAKKAGFKKGDILVAVDNRSDRMTEGTLIAYLLNDKKKGDRVVISVLRGSDRIDMNFPTQ